MNAGGEEWRPVVGWEGFYAVSDWGRVKSCQRVVMRSNGASYTCGERILKTRTAGVDGLLMVSLWRGGDHTDYLVHNLVLEAFVGPRPAGLQGLRSDGDRANNRLENLHWGTRSEMMHIMVQNGTHPQASKARCDRGHEFTLENTYTLPNGGRSCIQCQADRGRAWYEDNREEILDRLRQESLLRKPEERSCRFCDEPIPRSARVDIAYCSRECKVKARAEKLAAYQRTASAKAKAKRRRDKLQRAILADHSGASWTQDEDDLVMRDDLKITEMASRLRRTMSAVKGRRYNLRKAESPGL